MVKKEERRIDVPDLKRKAYETRIIVVAQGIEAHDEDTCRNMELIKEAYSKKRKTKKEEERRKKILKTIEKYYEPYWMPALDYLHKKFGSSFEIEENASKIKEILSENKVDVFESVRKVGRFTSEKQKVKFVIVTVVSKKDFKKALETDKPELHVIYDGHSRYGRGACFDTYTGIGVEVKQHQEGNQWERGNGDDNGLFRLAYPYVAVPLEDVKHHKYFFTPVSIEEGVPPKERKHPFSRHPKVRRKSFKKVSIPLELQHLIWPTYESKSKQYHGYTKLEKKGKKQKKKVYVLFHAGWAKTLNSPYDLGESNLECRVFCHFGCSSRLHYWHIVRRKEYKGWERPKPPTDKYAYFTTAPSDARISPLWLYYLLAYDKKNNYKHWWQSLEWAKKRANKKLRRIKAGYQIY